MPKPKTMTPARLKAWRHSLQWAQPQAATALDVSLKLYQKFEQGERPINRRLRLACWALAHGCEDYAGESTRYLGV